MLFLRILFFEYHNMWIKWLRWNFLNGSVLNTNVENSSVLTSTYGNAENKALNDIWCWKRNITSRKRRAQRHRDVDGWRIVSYTRTRTYGSVWDRMSTKEKEKRYEKEEVIKQYYPWNETISLRIFYIMAPALNSALLWSKGSSRKPASVS